MNRILTSFALALLLAIGPALAADRGDPPDPGGKSYNDRGHERVAWGNANLRASQNLIKEHRASPYSLEASRTAQSQAREQARRASHHSASQRRSGQQN